MKTSWRTPVSISPSISRHTGKRPTPRWRRPWTPCWDATWAPPHSRPTPPASLDCRYTSTCAKIIFFDLDGCGSDNKSKKSKPSLLQIIFIHSPLHSCYLKRVIPSKFVAFVFWNKLLCLVTTVGVVAFCSLGNNSLSIKSTPECWHCSILHNPAVLLSA